MDKVVTIYDAKAHLSKLVKQAQAGKTTYIGAYGQPQAIIAPLPAARKIQLGVYAHKALPDAYDDDDLLCPDPELAAQVEASVNRPFPS